MTFLKKSGSLQGSLAAILILLLPHCLKAQQTQFDPDAQGYIKHWYNSGLSMSPYTKDFGLEANIRNERKILNATPLEFEVPTGSPFNTTLASGTVLKLYTMGSNTDRKSTRLNSSH